MIRYVLAVVLTVAIAAISVPAIDHAAGVNSDRQVGAAVAEIEATAVDLVDNEAVPPAGQAGAKRTITVAFPGESLTSNRVEYVRIERIHENVSRVGYVVEGRVEQQTHVDAPVVNEDGGTVRLGADPGERTLHLTLERDDSGSPVVVLGRGHN